MSDSSSEAAGGHGDLAAAPAAAPAGADTGAGAGAGADTDAPGADE